MKTAIAILIATILTGCSSISYQSPEGAKITVRRLGLDTSIGALDATTTTTPNSNAKRLHLEGYSATPEQKTIDALLEALKVR